MTGAAALLTAGLAAEPARAHARRHHAGALRAAAAHDGRILALTVEDETAGAYAVRPLAVADGRPELGAPLGIDLGDGFHPHSMASAAGSLWITGAVELDADRSRPGLIRVDGDAAEAVEPPVAETIRSGVATAVTPIGETAIAVATVGSADRHLAAISRSHLAVSTDGGDTWTHRPLADDLGESFGTVLAAAGDRLYAVTADGDGTQHVYIGGADTELELLATEAGAGRPMAAVATVDERILVFSDQDGRAHLLRYGRGGPESADESADRPAEIVAVPGRPGAWLEVHGDDMRAERLG
ncbi:hypothetical protein GCM10027447_31650 [Glycomyces halotolerans]